MAERDGAGAQATGAETQRSLPGQVLAAFVDEVARTRPRVPGPPGVMLAAIALGVVGLAMAQVQLDPEPPVASAFEVAVPLGVTLPVLAAGWWTTVARRGRQKHAAAVYVSLLFMAIATATVAVIVLTQLAAGSRAFDWPFAVTTTLGVGALVGTPTGFAIDEVIARQEALEAEHRATARLNERLRVLNRVMRHNIRNELTVALGGLEMAAADLEADGAREWADRATVALERLLDHANKVLRLDRLETTRDRREAVELVAYVEGFLEATEYERPRVTLETDLPAAARVSAHPLIGTAVVEVIDNAIVHTASAATVEIDVTVVERDDAVEVTVADTGRGLPALEREALESPAESSLTHGGGVGLWLAKWVVEASDGTLSVTENEPRGTVVRLRLPRADGAATAPA